ncbi:adenylate/guanylate cyclase domain-containing protein [Chelatococcus sp. SYSU_G07232]|uniref:Adenylate/guanylate cyclase domain-containing protein n=1 Tax=Chelatococcus albus TaxID=3047466 RepID=A0ABT7AJ95_9HYPH|nr:adenylate/guanylate cyclase domain-containing protein [Chelatococcus sp. SYSU_G07232]MDJ1159449.1 adenylate/guanylate cyclase domain-containing protein [Chelatococcus sp. SYSU_G07232]
MTLSQLQDSRGARLAGRLFGRFGRLPARVQAIVDGETQAAEILSAWLVFGIVLLLGLLYLLTPKALDAVSELRPVPIAVSIGLMLGMLRLTLAHTGRMHGIAVTLFTVADFALLYGLIWTFHLQYWQPPAFSLKAPSFLFTFLLIAVRTLRFEPRVVVMAGLTAAIGWAVMAWLVFTDARSAVTRDFVVYMTSNAMLIGAEVEKIVAILLFTAVLTLSIARARRALLTAAIGHTVTEDLSRFFDPEIAERITRAEELAPGRGETRAGAILMTDIRGFTTLAARLPPSEVIRLLVAYQRRMTAVITAHGGTIDKFLGDGILATFGCAHESAAAAAQALQAMLDLDAEAERFAAELAAEGREPVEIGIAVAAGQVIFGTVGDGDRLEFTVIGEPVNRVTKLEKHNRRLGARAVTDRNTFTLAEAQGFAGAALFAAAPGEQVPGIEEPLDLVYLPRRDGGRSRADGAALEGGRPA